MTILPQLEHDLFDAAARRLPAEPRPTSRARTSGHFRSIGGRIAIVLSVAVVVAVATVALTVIPHGSRSTSLPVGGQSVGSARAELIRALAVLRRPQTPADLNPVLMSPLLGIGNARGTRVPDRRYIPYARPRSVLAQLGDPKLDRDLARVVNVAAWPAKVLIAPTTFRPSPGSRRRTEGVTLVLGINIASSPTSASTVLARGLSLFIYIANGTNRGVVLVPDGVARVRLTALRPSLPSGQRPPVNLSAFAAALRAIHLTAPVFDNIAALELRIGTIPGTLTSPAHHMSTTIEGLGASAQATWLGPHGQVIKRTTIHLGLSVRVLTGYNATGQPRTTSASELLASAREPIAARLRQHFAIFRNPVPPPATIKTLPRQTAVMIASQGYGLNITQSRYVPYPGTPGLWVIPGARGVAIAQLSGGSGSTSNAPVSLALSDRMITTTGSAPPKQTISGLVPDGNPTVTIVFSGGATRTVRVIDNVYTITTTRKARFVIANNAAGQRIRIPAPG
ncbi:MAG: hypothetical protein ACYC0H_15815 [Solirubrobacteraceae bacterium]